MIREEGSMAYSEKTSYKKNFNVKQHKYLRTISLEKMYILQQNFIATDIFWKLYPDNNNSGLKQRNSSVVYCNINQCWSSDSKLRCVFLESQIVHFDTKFSILNPNFVRPAFLFLYIQGLLPPFWTLKGKPHLAISLLALQMDSSELRYKIYAAVTV